MALYMIIAWRTLFVTLFGRIYPDLDCEFIFTFEPWQAVHLVLNQTSLQKIPPKISEIIPMIARLCSHLGRKNDREPGPTSIWIGLQRMRDFVLVLDAIKKTQRIPSEDIPIFV